MTQLDLFHTYPREPGWKAQDTSRDAAHEVRSSAATLRARIMAVLELNKGTYTADEVAEFLGVTPFSARPRFSELYAQGQIVDTGARRKNTSGHSAIVWRSAK